MYGNYNAYENGVYYDEYGFPILIYNIEEPITAESEITVAVTEMISAQTTVHQEADTEQPINTSVVTMSEELIEAEYIQRKGKQLISTEYGRAFAASLPENVKSAELTAQWEQALSDIESGTGKAEGLIAEIEKNVTDIIALEKSKGNRITVSRRVEVGKCPRCGKPVVANSKGFSCSAGRENCGFFIFKEDKRIGRSYTAAEISELLSRGKVTLKNCTSSKGNKYSAVFSLDDTGKYVNLKLEEFVGGKKKK